jgi:lysophospholipase L1-like esterase
VAFTDLTGIFAGRREALYVDDCCHVGPAGYALIADAVADGLLAPVAPSPKAGPE